MNSFGNLFRITLYGESHSKTMGVIIDGVRPGLFIDYDLIRTDLARRRPSKTYETTRIEQDEFEITSGIKDGYATGAPMHISISNSNFDSSIYEDIKHTPRPGTSDMVAYQKYHGFNDYRGSGMFSGRLTVLYVVAGSIAKMMSPFAVSSRIKSIGSETKIEVMEQILEVVKKQKDSIGGVIEIKATKLIPGLGEPFFGKLTSEIARMMFSIPAVKGVDFGIGFEGVHLMGSEFIDEITDTKGTTKTNNAGGINAGISNGNDIIVNCFIKPISSISKDLKTINLITNLEEVVHIEGKHDSTILNRIGVVLEAALHIVLLDQLCLAKIHG